MSIGPMPREIFLPLKSKQANEQTNYGPEKPDEQVRGLEAESRK